MIIQVTLLDGNEVQFELEGKCSGDELLNKVTEHVQLTEKDYFGFLHVDSRDKTLTWLHGDRTLAKQLKEDKKCFFQVKFYPPEPAQLQEDLTRYQMVSSVVFLFRPGVSKISLILSKKMNGLQGKCCIL